MRRFMKKRVLIALSVVAVLAMAGAAIAYWTQSGGGSTTATVGTTGTITLQATVTPGIYPGGSTPVALTASNSGSAPVKVQVVSVTAISVDAGHSSCSTADFSMAPVTENTSVPGGASTFALGTAGSLVMTNTAVAQDACKGATLTLTLSST